MPLSSGLKSKPLLYACLHDLLFHPEEEVSTFLRNVDEHLLDYTASVAEYSSQTSCVNHKYNNLMLS
jgi:hypothetical protein